MALPSSNLISKILTPALRLWLRSQVEKAEELEIEIQGKDGQILRGYLPGVALRSDRAIYQGLQLGRVLLKGENIRINIGQVIKGKPLQLLEPIRVSGEVQLTEKDLQTSLGSEILANAFTELLMALLEHQGIEDPAVLLEPYQIQWQAIALQSSGFTLTGSLSQAEEINPLKIRADLALINPQTLHLQDIELLGLPVALPQEMSHLQVDLGTDVEIESLQLDPGELACVGQLLIRP